MVAAWGLSFSEVQAAGSVLTADADAGVIINGQDAGANLGRAAASSGDFNGDGIKDVIIGSTGAQDDSGVFSGRVYIFFGATSPGSPLIAKDNADIIIDGPTPPDNRQNFGWSVNFVGDFNDDGFDDVIVGENNVEDMPDAYIFFGRDTGSSQLVLQAETHANVILRSTTPPEDAGLPFLLSDRFGFAVSGAGDWNKDGIDDVLIGAHANSTLTNPGYAYIFFGKSSITSQLVLEDKDANVIIVGRHARSHFAVSVAHAGDFNGDNIDDVVISATQDSTAGSRAGSAFVFFGRKTGSTQLVLSASTDANVILNGSQPGTQFGTSVSGAGDFTGNGKSDVIVGAWSDANTNGDTNVGRAYIFRGRDTGSNQLTIGANNADVILDGEETNDLFGGAVSGGGDYNNDGLSDVIVGANEGLSSDLGTGKTYIFFGNFGCTGRIDASAANVLLNGQDTGDKFGGAVSLTGDFNKSGSSDAVIGANWDRNHFSNTQAGRTFVFYGNAVADNLQITGCPASTINPIASGGETNLSVQAIDDLSHSVNYSWQSDCSVWSVNNGEFSNRALQNPLWRPPLNSSEDPQDCTISVSVDDGAGLVQTARFFQTVSPAGSKPHVLEINQQPVGTPDPVTSGQVVSLTVQATDTEDTHTLAYTWQADCSSWSASNGSFNNSSAQNPNWTSPPNNTGVFRDCQISVAVDDGPGGLSQTASFNQTVSAATTGAGSLVVENLGNINSFGVIGGPFYSPSREYLLRNDSSSSLFYAATRSATWVSITPSVNGGVSANGILSPGESIAITVSINSSATQLPVGNFSGGVNFEDITNGSGVGISVNLVVSPVQLVVSNISYFPRGAVGGPFSVVGVGSTGYPKSTLEWDLENKGAMPLEVLLEKQDQQDWLSLPPGCAANNCTVLLNPGESKTITFTVNDNANTYCIGDYFEHLIFTNVTNGSGNTSRTVRLNVFSAENILPIVFPPSDITANATGNLTNLGLLDIDPNGTARALDNPDGALRPFPENLGPLFSETVPYGFPFGTTEVVWAATDCSGNTGRAIQKVNIVDLIGPTLTIPDDVTWNTTSVPVTVDIGQATATDNVDINLVPTNNAPSQFYAGETPVHWSVTDSAGHTVVKTQTIKVNLIGSLDIQCMHTPLWPQPGDTVTITATAVDPTDQINLNSAVTGIGNKTVNEVEIWFEDINFPLQVVQNDDTATYTSPVLSSGTFKYGCNAKQTVSSAFSGWREVAVGSPGDGQPIPVIYTGPSSHRADVVFIADADSYTGSDDPAFLADITTVIAVSYYNYPLYLKHQDEFNFWISRNTGTAGRESSGVPCEVNAPSDWEENYAFKDTGALIHTDNFRDCAKGGIFTSRISAGNNRGLRIVRHETGHSPFGLRDEYCCDGGYGEQNIFPNLYKTLQSCIEDAPNFGKSDLDCYTLGYKCTADPNCSLTQLLQLNDLDFIPFLLEPPIIPDVTSGFINDLMDDEGDPGPADRRRIEWYFDQCAAGSDPC